MVKPTHPINPLRARREYLEREGRRYTRSSPVAHAAKRDDDAPKPFLYPGGRRLIKGRRFDGPELTEMGLLPPEMAQTSGTADTFSTVTDVNHEARTVTFDSARPPKRKKGRR